MRANVAVLLSALALAACSAVGARHTEEPAHHLVARIGDVEVRQYGARIAAETPAGGDQDAARSAGFRRLSDYVSGANQGGTRIGMAVPFGESQDGAGRWRIRVFLPAGVTRATLPRPTDPSVTLIPVPPETLAVLRYAGKPGAETVSLRIAELVKALEGSAWRPAGEPVAWFYDPPWTLAPPRRNEVAIPVSPK